MTRYEPIMPTLDPTDPLDLALLAADALGESADNWMYVALGALVGGIIAFTTGVIWALHAGAFTPFWIGWAGAMPLIALTHIITRWIVDPRLDACDALVEHVRQTLEAETDALEHCGR